MTQQQRDPIFASVGQALYVAFVLEYTPLGQKGGTQLVIEDMRKRGGYASEVEHRTNRPLNMGKMTPLEFRGQCAVIRRRVEDPEFLKPMERAAIFARYGLQLRQANGVRSIRDELVVLCDSRNDSAVLALCWVIYDRRGAITLADIEREHRVHRRTLTRDLSLLKKLTLNIELRAEHRIEAELMRRGLIGD